MEIFRIIKNVILRRKLAREMETEMRAHLEGLTKHHVASGLSLEDARLAARRDFGGQDQVRENALDERGGRWLEDSARDFSHACRSLRRHPVFSIVAIASLALAIGSATAIFSLVNGILLRSLPVPKPEQLRVLSWTMPKEAVQIAFQRMRPSDFATLRAAAEPAADLFGYTPITGVNARGDALAFTTQGMGFSGNAMRALGAQSHLGRILSPDDDLAGAAPVVVIGFEMWKRRLDSDPHVIGRSLRLNEGAFTIVGVMREGFRGIDDGDSSEFFISLESAGLIEPSLGRGKNTKWTLGLMARMTEGATDAQLATVVTEAFRVFEPNAPTDQQQLVIANGRAGPDWGRGYYREALTRLSLAVGFLMLVACANLTGLSVVRGLSRTREHAVRAALGAGKGRLIRAALMENLVLALIGGATGVLLTWILHAPLSRLVAGTEEGLYYNTSIDLRVGAFALALAVVTAVVSGILPGLRAAKVDPIQGLKSGGHFGTRRLTVIRGLVSLQVALSVVLLACTGLYARSLQNLLRIDPGFPVEQRLVFRLKTREKKSDAIINFHHRVQAQLQTVPGVTGVTTLNLKPLLGIPPRSANFVLPTTEGPQSFEARRVLIGRDFFQTMKIPLIVGRFPIEGEKGAVVSELFAKTLGGPMAALDSTISLSDKKSNWRIVGVCQDSKLSGIKFPYSPTVYTSLDEAPLASIYYVVDAALRPDALMRTVREAVAKVDDEVAIAGASTQVDIRAKNLRRENLVATLVGALGAMALFLCAIGLYGVVSFSVGQRTREFGVRLALGADWRAITQPILREALILTAAGTAVGLSIALFLSNHWANDLYGVNPNDPSTLIAVSLVLALVSVTAAWIPASRAAKVDPLVALRAE